MAQTSKHFVLAHFFTIGIGFINTVSWHDQYLKLVPMDDKSEIAFALLDITSDRSTIGCIKQCSVFHVCDVVAVPSVRNQASDCVCLVSLKSFPTTSAGVWFYSDRWKIYAKKGGKSCLQYNSCFNHAELDNISLIHRRPALRLEGNPVGCGKYLRPSPGVAYTPSVEEKARLSWRRIHSDRTRGRLLDHCVSCTLNNIPINQTL